jgi:hypothetical protein
MQVLKSKSSDVMTVNLWLMSNPHYGSWKLKAVFWVLMGFAVTSKLMITFYINFNMFAGNCNIELESKDIYMMLAKLVGTIIVCIRILNATSNRSMLGCS